MKILIITDIEGVSCIDRNCMSITTGSSEWEKHGRGMITRDVKQAVERCIVLGAEKVVICDCHDQGNSIIRNEFFNYEGVTFIDKDTLIEISEQSYNAALLIGFHAMNGLKGFYPHTYRSDIHYIKYNEKEIGEVGVISEFLNELKIPLIMISGDEITIEEAKSKNSQIEGAIVKYSNLQKNYILSRDEADREIAKAIGNAFEKINTFEFKNTMNGFNVEVSSKDPEFIDDLVKRDIGEEFKIVDERISWFSPNASEAMKRVHYILKVFGYQSHMRYSKNFKFYQELRCSNLYDINENVKKIVNDLENSNLLYSMTTKDRIHVKEVLEAFDR